MPFEFLRPEIKDEPNKPIPIGNQTFHYSSIASDRRFEELIYSIYKQEIEYNPQFRAEYDDIMLMQGTGEQGRDCVLYKNNKIIGIIQCKKYNKRISMPDCVNEILKCILYSVADPAIITDINNFNYYLVASNGFTSPAQECLDDFGSLAGKPEDIKQQCEAVKRNYKSLQAIDIPHSLNDILEKVKKIKITKIDQHGLDLNLSKSYNENIVQLFFSVRTVVDTGSLDKFEQNLKDAIANIGNEVNIPDEEIEKKFAGASLQLSNWKSTISNLKNCHIERNETGQILNWIKTPLKNEKDPILLLAGNPGYGKSVILKDVYHQLLNENIPTVAIKSDRYMAASIDELSEKLNFGWPPVSLIRKIASTHSIVVILIDQIDALSQSVTSKRDYIDTYNKLIFELKNIPGIRIIISVRIFDLNYDFELSYYKKYTQITVNKLNENEVNEVLTKIGLSSSGLSEKLLEVLSIPNHLDLFCKVYNTQIDLNNIRNVHDLYNELWNQNITCATMQDTGKLKDCLFAIADLMHQSQSLEVSCKSISVQYPAQLPYLLSKGLIIEEADQLQFLHQSFYDYVFAKTFVESGKSLLHYIIANHQSFYIRSSVKMILSFLKQQKEKDYIKTITRLFTSGKIRFHIRLLVIYYIAFETNPTVSEKNFVKRVFLKSDIYFHPFMEAVQGVEWFNFLQSENIANRLLYPKPTFIETYFNKTAHKRLLRRLNIHREIDKKSSFTLRRDLYHNIWRAFLLRLMPEYRLPVLKHLCSTEDFENREDIIFQVLSAVKIWDCKEAFELFYQLGPVANIEWLWLENMLADAAGFDFDWSVSQFSTAFFSKKSNQNASNEQRDEHAIEEYFKKLKDIHIDKFFLFLLKFLKEIISTCDAHEQYYIHHFLEDDIFNLSISVSDIPSGMIEMLYVVLTQTASELAQQRSINFEQFVTRSTAQKDLPLMKVVLSALEANAPAYPDLCFLTIEMLFKESIHQDYKYFIRNIILKYYPVWNTSQKEKINDLIMSLSHKEELRRYADSDGKVKLFGYEQFEYLSSIPRSELFHFPFLKKAFLELERRHEKAENRRNGTTLAYIVGPPISHDAYNKMSLADWENSFKKFNEHYEPPFSSHKGGLSENANAFENEVAGRPYFFLPLIYKIMDGEEISRYYVIAGINGLVKGNYDPTEFAVLFKKIYKEHIYSSFKRQLIRMTGYLNQNDLIDQDLFDFLCDIALNDPDPAKVLNPNNQIIDSFNNNRGMAVHEIVRCFRYKRFAEKIFSTLFKVANDPMDSVRIASLIDLAVLMNVDKERTLQLFLRLINNSQNVEMYESSIRAVQYLSDYNFEALQSYFREAMKFDKLQKKVSIMLTVSWLKKHTSSYSLLQEAWRISDEAKAAVVDVAVRNYTNSDAEIKSRCYELYCLFLNDDNDKIIKEYNSAFWLMNESDFKAYLDILLAFIKANNPQHDFHYFLEYLLKCCKGNPIECFNLLLKIKNSRTYPLTKNAYYADLPLKITIGAYNSLNEKKELNVPFLNKILDLFDKFLKSDVFKYRALNELDTV